MTPCKTCQLSRKIYGTEAYQRIKRLLVNGGSVRITHGKQPIIRMKIKRKRRTAGGMLGTSQHTFANVVALAKWITENISDAQKQEKLMSEGIRNAYTITVTMFDRSEKLTRSTPKFSK